MNPNEVAAITGVSVRTLHHYDAIGLLCPARNESNGYREYAEADLDLLQQILFFRACGFSLRRIGALLHSPAYDRDKAFALQQKTLLHERQRIDAMLHTLDKSMKASKGDCTMTTKDKFAGFDFSKNPYEAEARALWGDQAVEQSNAAIADQTHKENNALEQRMNALFKRLAAIRHEAPDAAPAQAAMDEMYRFFHQSFGVHYSLDAFAGLGQLYITDARFTQNIDQFGDGLAAFLAKAMTVYARKRHDA